MVHVRCGTTGTYQFLDGSETTETQLENNTNHKATTGGVLNWITSLNRNEVATKTDYTETVNSVAKTYTTISTTEGLQSEITANTTAITATQNELNTLGIASLVKGLFTFTSKIIRTSVLASEIAKCMKLQGQNNLTGNLTSSSDTYTFYGAKSSHISYLSNVSSYIQGQINNITGNYLLSSTASYIPN